MTYLATIRRPSAGGEPPKETRLRIEAATLREAVQKAERQARLLRLDGELSVRPVPEPRPRK